MKTSYRIFSSLLSGGHLLKERIFSQQILAFKVDPVFAWSHYIREIKRTIILLIVVRLLQYIQLDFLSLTRRCLFLALPSTSIFSRNV